MMVMPTKGLAILNVRR